jgi:hypothetical protein
MSPFVTPLGTDRVVHIWRPFGMSFGPIWYCDLAVEISWADVAANYPQTGPWWFGVLSTPTINNSTEKIPVLSGEVGTGSTTRVSRDIVSLTLVVGCGAAQSSAERCHRATHQVRPEHPTLRCGTRWPHAAITADARPVISRSRVNQLRGTWMAGLSWWSGQRK